MLQHFYSAFEILEFFFLTPLSKCICFPSFYFYLIFFFLYHSLSLFHDKNLFSFFPLLFVVWFCFVGKGKKLVNCERSLFPNRFFFLSFFIIYLLTWSHCIFLHFSCTFITIVQHKKCFSPGKEVFSYPSTDHKIFLVCRLYTYCE